MTPIRVLLIEDQEQERELYLRFIKQAERLTPNEIEMDVCGSIAEAYIKIEDRRRQGIPFDMAMVDLGLPDSHTDMTMGAIPTLKRDWGVLIFIITGHETIEYRDKCLAMGADEFTTKPKLLQACGCVLERVYNCVTKERLLGHDYGKK